MCIGDIIMTHVYNKVLARTLIFLIYTVITVILSSVIVMPQIFNVKTP